MMLAGLQDVFETVSEIPADLMAAPPSGPAATLPG